MSGERQGLPLAPKILIRMNKLKSYLSLHRQIGFGFPSLNADLTVQTCFICQIQMWALLI